MRRGEYLLCMIGFSSRGLREMTVFAYMKVYCWPQSSLVNGIVNMCVSSWMYSMSGTTVLEAK